MAGILGYLIQQHDRQKEEEKLRARKFKSLVEYADASELVSKDAAMTMDLDTLEGRVRGYAAQMDREKDIAFLDQYKAQTEQRQRSGRDAAVFQRIMQDYGRTPARTAVDPEGLEYTLPETASTHRVAPMEFAQRWGSEGGSMEGLLHYGQFLDKVTGTGDDFNFDPQRDVQAIPQIPGLYYGRTSRGGGQILSTTDRLGDIAREKEDARRTDVTQPIPEAPDSHPGKGMHWAWKGWKIGYVMEKDTPDNGVGALTETLRTARGGTNAPTASPDARTGQKTTPEQQAILDDFAAGKLSRDAARKKLNALGLK